MTKATTIPFDANTLNNEVGHIRSEIRQLSQERESLALNSLQGDASATKRIALIDAERVKLNHRRETLEGAIRELRRNPPPLATPAVVEQNWERIKASVLNRVVERYGQAAFKLKAHMSNDGPRGSSVSTHHFVDEMMNLPWLTALEYLNYHVPEPRAEMSGNTMDDAWVRESEGLKARRKELIERLTDQLLAEVKFPEPPDEFKQMLTRFNTRDGRVTVVGIR